MKGDNYMKKMSPPAHFKTFNVVYNLTGIEDDFILPHSNSGTCEIILSLTTGGHVIIKNKIYPLTKKNLYFIYGPDVHHPAPDDKDTYTRHRIIISLDFLRTLVKYMELEAVYDKVFLQQGGVCCPLSDDDFKKADSFFNTLDQYCLQHNASSDKNNPFKKYEAISAIVELLSLGYYYCDTTRININKSVDRALRYIDANIKRNISIEDIGEYCHLNKYYLCHLFKSVVKMTISKYIRVKRISLAKKELEETDISISQISENAGFNSVSYFGKIFYEDEGVTPSEYRKMSKDGTLESKLML